MGFSLPFTVTVGGNKFRNCPSRKNDAPSLHMMRVDGHAVEKPAFAARSVGLMVHTKGVIVDNAALAAQILEKVGGADNVKNVYHCATRLRFTLAGSDNVDVDALKGVPGVLNVLGSGAQIQVVIGQGVPKVYAELTPLLGERPEDETVSTNESEEKGKPLDRVFNAISGIFAPYLPLLMGAGILTGLLTLATNLGWLDASSGTYGILYAAANSLFYFFPILLAYSASKQFNTNPYVAVVIGAALLHPSFTALAESGDPVTFLGIPVVMQTYSSSVIPSIAGVGLYAIVDHQLSKVVPDSLRSLVITLVGLVAVIPLTVLVIGPVGNSLSNLLGVALNSLVSFNPVIAGIVAGGFCGYLAMFGLQWGIIPILIMNISAQGFDYFTPMWVMACYAQIGVALAVAIRAKNAEFKELGVTSFVTGLFTGVTEPILYGILTRFLKLNVFVVLGGAVGGAFVGLMRTKAIAFLFAGVLNFPGYFGDTFPYYVIGMALAIGVSCISTLALGFRDAQSGSEILEA